MLAVVATITVADVIKNANRNSQSSPRESQQVSRIPSGSVIVRPRRTVDPRSDRLRDLESAEAASESWMSSISHAAMMAGAVAIYAAAASWIVAVQSGAGQVSAIMCTAIAGLSLLLSRTTTKNTRYTYQMAFDSKIASDNLVSVDMRLERLPIGTVFLYRREQLKHLISAAALSAILATVPGLSIVVFIAIDDQSAIWKAAARLAAIYSMAFTASVATLMSEGSRWANFKAEQHRLRRFHVPTVTLLLFLAFLSMATTSLAIESNEGSIPFIITVVWLFASMLVLGPVVILVASYHCRKRFRMDSWSHWISEPIWSAARAELLSEREQCLSTINRTRAVAQPDRPRDPMS